MVCLNDFTINRHLTTWQSMIFTYMLSLFALTIKKKSSRNRFVDEDVFLYSYTSRFYVFKILSESRIFLFVFIPSRIHCFKITVKTFNY